MLPRTATPEGGPDLLQRPGEPGADPGLRRRQGAQDRVQRCRHGEADAGIAQKITNAMIDDIMEMAARLDQENLISF
jgi:hypothetical protein